MSGIAGFVEFVCLGCGLNVKTLRRVNYRTIPPTMGSRNLCDQCKEDQVSEPVVTRDEVLAIRMKRIEEGFDTILTALGEGQWIGVDDGSERAWTAAYFHGEALRWAKEARSNARSLFSTLGWPK